MATAELRLPPFRIVHAAYVTPDLEQGKRRLAATCGVHEFKVIRGAPIEVPGGVAMIDFAVAEAGGTHFEVIAPKGGRDGVYRNALPADPGAIRFHHFASRIADQGEWDMVAGAAARDDIDVLVHGDSDDLKYIYLDLREHLGHILEYIWYCNPAAEAVADGMAVTEAMKL